MGSKKIERHSKCGLLLAIFGLFILLNSIFLIRYIEVLNNQTNIISKSIALLLLGWIILSSFYACYHLCSFVFSVIIKKRSKNRNVDYLSTPNVAILYPCMNDFKAKAVDSYLRQTYANYHIFILDDSDSFDEKRKIDAYQESHVDRISIFRRQDRQGYKAGNLNYALSLIQDQYKYFAVMDSDEIIPEKFLTETAAVAEANPGYGFIQTAHTQYGETPYAQKTGDCVDLHWNYFLPARNDHGFVYYYGHGALIRMEACLRAGGFPEIVAEDLALAVRLRQLGYEGYYLDTIVCREETPRTYYSWRKREGKVATGTLEFIAREFWNFAKSKNIPVAEKLDLVISSSIIYMPLLFLGFISLLYIILPIFYSDSYSFSSPWLKDSGGGYIHTAAGVFKPLWGWDTLAFTLFIIFAPLCYIVPALFKRPMKIITYIWYMNTVQLSNTLNISKEVFEWIWTRKSAFLPTGDRTKKSHVTSWNRIESLAGLALVLIGIKTLSLCLMATGFSIFLVPLLLKKNLQGSPSAVLLVLLPMTLTILAFGIIPFGLLGFTGIFAGIALAHH